ncbi:hypothetical protein ACQCVP_08865 [Rossellomorea vietnamensis]
MFHSEKYSRTPRRNHLPGGFGIKGEIFAASRLGLISFWNCSHY